MIGERKIQFLVWWLLLAPSLSLAVPGPEQDWIMLERGHPQEVLASCAGGSDMLSRWLVAVAEARLERPPSAADPVSRAARAFEAHQYDQAVELLEPLLASSSPGADQLHERLWLGAGLVELGRMPEAEAMLTRAVDQARAERRTMSLCFGLLTRGRARVRLRQVDPPRQDLQEALDLCRGLETHRWAGVAAIALSVISRLQMDLDDALSWREKALEYYRHAGDLSGQARALHYIAAIGIMRGELTGAMAQLQDADRLARQAEDQGELGGILGEMAAINYLLGDFDKALTQYQEAVRLAPNPWRRGMMLVNIGSIYEYRGEPEQARPALGEALDIMEQVGDHRTATQALQALAEALLEQEQWSQGMDYLDQAITTARQYDIPMSEASALEIKGHGLLQQGELAAAGKAFAEATRLARQIDYFDILEWSLLGQAQVARQRGDRDQALAYLQGALSEVAQVRRRSGGSARVTGGLQKQAGGLYEEMIDLLFEMHQAAPDQGYDRQAFDVAEEARARSFLDLLAEADYDLNISAVPGYRDSEREILSRIVRLENRVKTAPADSVGHLRAQLATAEDELQILAARLRARDPRYAEVLYPQPLPAEQVSSTALEKDEVLLEYALGERASYLWVVSARSFRMVALPGRAEVEKQTRALLPLLTSYNLTGQEAAWYCGPARDLYRLLLEPVAKEIEGAERLVICADGILNYLPFEALLTRDSRSHSFRELPYLVLEKVVSYTPSASVLGRLARMAPLPSDQAPWLLVGDPVLARGDDASLFARAAGAADLPSLPYAGRELRALAGLAPTPATMLTGARATRENLMRAGAQGPLSLVHFASHGLYNEARPRYSGLVISPDRQTGDDGFLSVSEVLALKLDCPQVVLSACASALGPHVSGAGLVGLTRSFIFAGARSVVSALWDVSGRETAQFMEFFYGRLSGGATDRAMSLTLAKRAMIQAEPRADVDPAHPVFWSAFVLSGKGR